MSFASARTCQREALGATIRGESRRRTHLKIGILLVPRLARERELVHDGTRARRDRVQNRVRAVIVVRPQYAGIRARGGEPGGFADERGLHGERVLRLFVPGLAHRRVCGARERGCEEEVEEEGTTTAAHHDDDAW